MSKITEKYEKWVKRHFKDNWDKIDFRAEFDSKQGIVWNKEHLQQKYSMFYIDKATKKEMAAKEEQNKAIILEQIKKEEKELLESWTQEKTEPITTDSFKLPKILIEMACRGITNGAILIGEGGLGKSFLALNTVKESGREFVYYNTHITPLALYKLLYKHNGKVIIFDDVKGLMNNDISIAILKGALDDKETRIITYETTSEKIEDIPEMFNWRGQLIILGNTWKATSDTQAIESRVKPYFLQFSYEEKVQILHSIAQKPYKDLSAEERDYCLQEILRIADRTAKNFNFRVLINAYKYYMFYRKPSAEFTELLGTMIEVDRDLYIIKTLMERGMDIDKQIKAFCKITGKSRRSYFLKKKLLCKSATENKCSFIDEELRLLGL